MKLTENMPYVLVLLLLIVPLSLHADNRRESIDDLKRRLAEEEAEQEREWKRRQEKRRQEIDEMKRRLAEEKAEWKRQEEEQRRKEAERHARIMEQEKLEKEQRQREQEEADRRFEEELRMQAEKEQREREQRSKALLLEIDAFYRDRWKLADEGTLDYNKKLAPDMTQREIIRTFCTGQLRIDDFPILYRERKLLEEQMGTDLKHILGRGCVIHGY